VQDALAGGRDFRHIRGTVHLREQHELSRIGCVDLPNRARARGAHSQHGANPRFRPLGAVSERQRKTVLSEPVDSFDGLFEGVRPALLLMQCPAVMVEVHSDDETCAMNLTVPEARFGYGDAAWAAWRW
jgi:hypothetical protein